MNEDTVGFTVVVVAFEEVDTCGEEEDVEDGEQDSQSIRLSVLWNRQRGGR